MQDDYSEFDSRMSAQIAKNDALQKQFEQISMEKEEYLGIILKYDEKNREIHSEL